MQKFLFTINDECETEAAVDYDNDVILQTSSEKIISIFSGKDFKECKEACIADVLDSLGVEEPPELDEDDYVNVSEARQGYDELKDKIEAQLGWYEFVDGGHNSTIHIG